MKTQYQKEIEKLYQAELENIAIAKQEQEIEIELAAAKYCLRITMIATAISVGLSILI